MLLKGVNVLQDELDIHSGNGFFTDIALSDHGVLLDVLLVLNAHFFHLCDNGLNEGVDLLLGLTHMQDGHLWLLVISLAAPLEGNDVGSVQVPFDPYQ